MSKIVTEAVKEFKEQSPEWKTFDESELYGELESIIDGLLFEDRYASYNYEETQDGVLLERFIFDAVKKCQKRGKRHSCDPYYDDAFDGYDCASKMK